MAQSRLSPAVITLIVVDAVLIVVLVVLMVNLAQRTPDVEQTAAITSSSASETPTEPESQEPSEDPASTQAATAPDDAVSIAQFVAPSRNIWCTIDEVSATCQIGEISYSPPPIADCGSDLAGHVLTVTEDGARYPCPSGDIAGAAPGDREELGYGTTTAVGAFMCTSSQTGVACTHLGTGAGFSVARAGASLY